MTDKALWMRRALPGGLMAAGLAALAIAGMSRAAQAPAGPGAVPLGPDVPADIADPGDPQQAATFAWQEFVALTWPAATNPNPAPGFSPYFRGQAATNATSGSTGPSGIAVFNTFYHRTELYPNFPTGVTPALQDPNAIPRYLYGGTVITKATPQTDTTVFANTDEASEINIAFMYDKPLAMKADAMRRAFPNPTPAQKAQIAEAAVRAGILYEAKGNPAMFAYDQQNQLYLPGVRRRAQAQAVNLIMNKPTTGLVLTMPTGTIEIKATWRHYDSASDDLSRYHWAKGLYYTSGPNGSLIAHNDTFLLIGLHIIHKTKNVPTFTFATFEHVDNEKRGFIFTNPNPQTCVAGASNCAAKVPRPLPDGTPPNGSPIEARRQFPIPGAGSGFNLVAFNQAMQAQLRAQFGASDVWANYQLIGVQALVADQPGGKVPAQQFFLSNLATETNDTLQFFQGGLTGPNGNVPGPGTAHVFTPSGGQYSGHTAGGCLGCHGSQGQFAGGDFSVISAGGRTPFQIEPVTPYPGGTVVQQNPKGFPLQPPTMGARLRRTALHARKGTQG